MNTFLTALLVDLLAPVAAANDLTPGLERAKRHLTEQIEAGGLVRYHGLPDGPGIGTLGCAITPDADDTALVWRIAPAPNRARLTAALTTLDQYRTPDGLYRTWLAPRERFQCIDPGHDPDPADLAIQMHVLLLLAQERPADARALCAALERVVDEDRVWVYYRLAPLVPMLRVADLSRVGCRLELPPARARSNVPGQELWVDAVDLLTHPVDASSAKARRTGAARYQDVLERIAAGDFAALRANPPLLYHNDLTASVRRYYWSEDVGYALFLRLVRASQSLATAPPSGGVSRHPAP